MAGPPEVSPAQLDQVLAGGARPTLRRGIGLAFDAVRLAWSAGPTVVTLALLAQVGAAAALGVEVFAGRAVLVHLPLRPGASVRTVVPALVVLAVAVGVGAVLVAVRSELQRLLGEEVTLRASQRLVAVVSRTDLLRFEDPEFNNHLQRATLNVAARPLQMTSGLLAVGAAALSSLALVVSLFLLQPLLPVLAIVAVLPLTLVSMRLGRAFYDFAVAMTPNDRRRAYLQQLLSTKDAGKEVRAYDLAEPLSAQFATLYTVRLAALRRLVRRRLRDGVAGGLLTGVLTGGTLAVLLLLVSHHRMSLSAAGAAAGALLLLGNQLQNLAAGVGNLYESALFIEDFHGFLSPPDGGERPPAEPAPGIDHIGTLRIEGVTFAYPSRDTPSLQSVSLTVEPGQIVALVGDNGSGKTTLAKLVAGLYQPAAGRITWHGVDIAGVDPASVRARVAVLFQDFTRYLFTLRENVTFGRWEAAGDDDRLADALRRSRAHQVAEALPRGVDTLLGPEFVGGSDLSVGQWQRLGLARAFFRDAELVILDEPTAAMDPSAEAALFASVRELFAGRSVLLISHRFATVRLADRIYVLHEGRLVEEGTHDELMAAAGRYAEMFTLQSAAFGLDPTTAGSAGEPP